MKHRLLCRLCREPATHIEIEGPAQPTVHAPEDRLIPRCAKHAGAGAATIEECFGEETVELTPLGALESRVLALEIRLASASAERRVGQHCTYCGHPGEGHIAACVVNEIATLTKDRDAWKKTHIEYVQASAKRAEKLCAARDEALEEAAKFVAGQKLAYFVGDPVRPSCACYPLDLEEKIRSLKSQPAPASAFTSTSSETERLTYEGNMEARSTASLDRLLGSKAELSVLDQRCEDLELMLRAAVNRDLGHGWYGDFTLEVRGVTLPGTTARFIVSLADDGTGLPLLTAEAREALKGKR